MKKLLLSLLLLSSVSLLLSCRTTEASVSASERSETVARSADRLCFSLMADSTSRCLTLSADSIIILFAHPFSQQKGIGPFPAASQESTSSRDAGTAALDDMYLHGYKPPAAKDAGSSAERDKQPTAQQPSAVSVYGLHIDASGNKRSARRDALHSKEVNLSSAKDSVAESTQSSVAETKDVRKSAPTKAPKYIFYILILACAIFLIYRFRDWLKNFLF